MKHIYKAGGVRKSKSGTEYTVRAVSDVERNSVVFRGWFDSIEELESDCKQADLLSEIKEEPKEEKPKKKKSPKNSTGEQL